jgi:uncharacterized protein (TIRG00374 family)
MSRSHWFSLLVSLLFLYLFLFDPAPSRLFHEGVPLAEALFHPRIEWSAVGRQIAAMHLGWFSLAFLFLMLAMVVRGLRWQAIVHPLKKLDFATMFGLNNLGYMANNLLPMRLGEVLRAMFLARKSGLGVPAAMATVVVERAFDMLGALACLFTLLLVVPADILGDQAGVVHQAVPALGGLAALGLLALLMLVVLRQRVQTLLEKLRLVLPARIADISLRLTASFLQGLSILESPLRTLWLVVLSILLYGCYFLSLKTMMLSMGLGADSLPLLAQHPFGSVLLVLVFVTVGYMIPAAPGAIGTVQYFTAIGLGLLGTDPSRAAGFALVNHFLTYAVLTGLGFIALFTLRIRFAELLSIQQEKP